VFESARQVQAASGKFTVRSRAGAVCWSARNTACASRHTGRVQQLDADIPQHCGPYRCIGRDVEEQREEQGLGHQLTREDGTQQLPERGHAAVAVEYAQHKRRDRAT